MALKGFLGGIDTIGNNQADGETDDDGKSNLFFHRLGAVMAGGVE